jgi:hypothetical protein
MTAIDPQQAGGSTPKQSFSEAGQSATITASPRHVAKCGGFAQTRFSFRPGAAPDIPSCGIRFRTQRTCYRDCCISVAAAGCQPETNASSGGQRIYATQEIAHGFAKGGLIILIQCVQEPVAQDRGSALSGRRGNEVHGMLLGSATTHLKHVTDALAGVLFDHVVALPRVGHELGYRHLALGLVVNGSGAPKSLHLPIAPSDSYPIVYHIKCMEVATCLTKRYFPIDFAHQRVLHDSHSLHMCRNLPLSEECDPFSMLLVTGWPISSPAPPLSSPALARGCRCRRWPRTPTRPAPPVA